jgi:GST-like protein
MAEAYRLFGCRGCGNVIIEAAFRLAGIAYEYEEADFDQPGPDRERLSALNPLGQAPTLTMPDGRVMTESAAIVLLVNDMAPEAGLVPPPGAPERARFLRWMVFFVAAIYPTFTYGDDPQRWLPDLDDASLLRTATDRHREKLWRQVEAEISPDPWFLGTRFSALDLYVGAMTHWRPRQAWFAKECPKLAAVAAEAERLPEVAPVFRRHFA